LRSSTWKITRKSPLSRKKIRWSLGAETVERRVHALETLDVAFLGVGETGESLENLGGGLLIDGAEARPHLTFSLFDYA